MRVNRLGFFLVAAMAAAVVSGCTGVQPGDLPPSSSPIGQPTTAPSPVGDLVPTPQNAASWDELRRQTAEARKVADGIISAFPPNKPGDYLALSTFYRPHALSDIEKAGILAISQTWEPLQKVLGNPDVIEMDVRDFVWKSFSNGNAVTVSDSLLAARGVSQKLLDYLGFDVLPGVFVLFHTSHDSYAYATAKIVVSPAAKKVVYCDAAVAAAEPPAAGGWDNVNPDSFRLDFVEGAQNPLSPNYDPNSVYGQEDTRFGPPWDHTTNLPGGASPAGTPTPSASLTTSAQDYSTLVESLRDGGITVEENGTISQPFMSVEGKNARVGGGLLQVFEYATPEAAEADSKVVWPDGSTFKKDNQVSSVDWIAPPHFFRFGRIIVLYVGQDKTVLDLLVKLLGNQFAGR